MRAASEMVLHDPERYPAEAERLLSAGYVPICDMVLVQRPIAGYPRPAWPELGYRPLARLGRAAFVELMERTLVGTANRLATGRSAGELLDEMIEEADSLFDPSWWTAVYVQDAALGVLLPQRVTGAPGWGTLSFLGLVPEARGRGLGLRLHQIALAALAYSGLEYYIDATDVLNTAMRNIFAANGCVEIGIERHYRIPL